MSIRIVRQSVRLLAGVLCLFVVAVVGCQAMGEMGVPGMSSYVPRSKAIAQQEKYRTAYQTDRDPQARKWLMANRLQNGMSVSEVNSVFGEDGVRQYDDTRFKTKGGNYRSSDKAYKWGPASDGSSTILFFRDDHLVNFDPVEFEN